MSVLSFNCLEGLLIVLDRGLMLCLPPLNYTLLHEHDLKSFLFSSLCSFPGLQKLVLCLSQFQIAFVVQLGDAIVIEGFKSPHFGKCKIFLVS